MIADYFNNFDLGALVSAGNSGNAGNVVCKSPNNAALPVTTFKTACKEEVVTLGNVQAFVTDVTNKDIAEVTAATPGKPYSNEALADSLPLLPLLPEKTPCYCCKGTNYWQSRINGDSICRKCHPPAPGAEWTSGKT